MNSDNTKEITLRLQNFNSLWTYKIIMLEVPSELDAAELLNSIDGRCLRELDDTPMGVLCGRGPEITSGPLKPRGDYIVSEKTSYEKTEELMDKLRQTESS